MNFKSKYAWVIVLIAFFSCTKQQQVTITNNSSSDLQQMAEIPLSQLSIKVTEGESYIVKDEKGGVIPSQLTFDEKLIFQVQVAPSTSQNFSVEKGEPQNYEPLVFGRYFPERKDDFAWENDKLGFRFYGKALEAVQAPTNGLDLWYKRTTRLVLEDWYRKDISKEASYHVDHGEGCDPYGVGTTLGGGAMAPFIDSLIVRNTNYETYEVLDNGPLRITAKLKYPNLRIGDKEITDERTVSLDAGSQYTKITQNYGDAKFTAAAGIVKRASADSIIVSPDKSYVLYLEPEDAKNGQIYLGLVFPEKYEDSFVSSYKIGENEFNHVVATKKYNGQPISYYTGFGWNKSDFKDINAFQTYTEKFVEAKNTPLEIEIK